MPAAHPHGHTPPHGRNAFPIEGETPRAEAGTAAVAPEFRFSRMGPKGPARLPQALRRKVAEAMLGPGRTQQHHPGRLHLPRPVRRPRPHLRRDRGGPRRPGLARRAAAGTIAPRSTSTRCTAPGRPTRSRPSSTPTTGTSRWARRCAPHPTPRGSASTSPAPARRSRAQPAPGPDPRPAQRREPRGGPAPPRDDPLPQPRGRHPRRRRPGRRALRAGPAPGRPALPVDAEDRLPAADLRPRRRRRGLHQRPQGLRGRRRPAVDAHDAGGVLGGGVPARPLDDPAQLRLEQALPRHRRHPGVPLRVLRHQRVPRRRRPRAAEQLDRRLPAPLQLPVSRTPRPQAAAGRQQPGPRHRHRARRLADVPAAGLLRWRRRRLRHAAGQPGLPQPHPRRHGPARDRPADGHPACGRRASRSPS